MYCANDLYNVTKYTTSHSIEDLVGPYGNHIPEAGYYSDVLDIAGDLERVEVRCLHYEDFDGRRTWSLSTVWFDGNPIMITQNAGREGRDHRERFITDAVGYVNMIAYIRTLIPLTPLMDQTDPTAPMEKLTQFYNHSLILDEVP